ncbi:hypothetical protein ABK040_010647 [Willaertia magna]
MTEGFQFGIPMHYPSPNEQQQPLQRDHDSNNDQINEHKKMSFKITLQNDNNNNEEESNENYVKSSCLTLLHLLTNFTFQTSTFPLFKQCRTVLKCFIKWLTHYLELLFTNILEDSHNHSHNHHRDLTAYTLSNKDREVMDAFSTVGKLLGGTISPNGDAVDYPPSIITLNKLNSYCNDNDFKPVFAGDFKVYYNSCYASASKAPSPFIPITFKSNHQNDVRQLATNLQDISNPRKVILHFYLRLAVKITNFILKFMEPCLLGSERQVLRDGKESLKFAEKLLMKEDRWTEARKNVWNFLRGMNVFE